MCQRDFNSAILQGHGNDDGLLASCNHEMVNIGYT